MAVGVAAVAAVAVGTAVVGMAVVGMAAVGMVMVVAVVVVMAVAVEGEIQWQERGQGKASITSDVIFEQYRGVRTEQGPSAWPGVMLNVNENCNEMTARTRELGLGES